MVAQVVIPGFLRATTIREFGHGADSALAEASGRADAECEVETAAHLLECDHVSRLHQPTLVEVLFEPAKSSSETSRKHRAGLAPREVVYKLHHEPIRFLDRRKERIVHNSVLVVFDSGHISSFQHVIMVCRLHIDGPK